jgi:hypothetical protein
LYNNKLNFHILEGTFIESEYLIPEILAKLKRTVSILTSITKCCFITKLPLFILAKICRCILSRKSSTTKNLYAEDLMCFRDYCLIAHYELGRLLFRKSTQKHVQVLLKMNDLHEVQKKYQVLKFKLYLSNRYQKEFVK